MNRKIEETPDHPKAKSLVKYTEVDLTSQALEAMSPAERAEAFGFDGNDLTPEQQRVTTKEVRNHAINQGTDDPSIPRGRNPDTAMCEDRDNPGLIDKDNDC